MLGPFFCHVIIITFNFVAGPFGRAESVIQPQPIILSREDYSLEGFDAQCVLPYRAATSGLRYVGMCRKQFVDIDTGYTFEMNFHILFFR